MVHWPLRLGSTLAEYCGEGRAHSFDDAQDGTRFNIVRFRTFAAMIIYNETYVMDEAIEQQWLTFMRTTQIPAIMKTGWFSQYKMLKILESPNEGVTYCLQLLTDKRSNYDYFLNRHLHQFHLNHNELFANRFVLFNTLMEEV